jgi:hypothetical protein
MGKYVIDGLLGPGGVTETYLAHVEGDSRQNAEACLYALKLLRRDRVPEKRWAEAVVRFLSAGQQLRDFHRAGFCPIVDLSDDPAATFIVSEYVVGRDLGRLLEASKGCIRPWSG